MRDFLLSFPEFMQDRKVASIADTKTKVALKLSC